ncbi:MAG TPA: hypothetical protein VMD74_04360, partial [Candidatus Methylomirabilis sp.]|nr:hypothetical protein [Candidatus Methylomirabilis sp.]
KNFQWLKNNYELSIINYKLLASAAAEISQKIPINSVDVIVTEPYLGPQRGKHDIQKTIIELEKLYSASLKEFAKVLKPNGRVVMVWPVFTGRGQHEWDFLNPKIDGWKIINPLPENLRDILKTTRRGTIIYGRPGQKVYREIVVLR